jgi:hypothetical protein
MIIACSASDYSSSYDNNILWAVGHNVKTPLRRNLSGLKIKGPALQEDSVKDGRLAER